MINENQVFLRANKYSSWEKSYKKRKFAFIPIIEFHARRVFKKKIAKLILIYCVLTTLFFVFAVAFDSIKDTALAGTDSVKFIIDFLESIEFMRFGSGLFYNFIQIHLFVWFLFVIITSSEIISMDRKLNALILYLSKPLDLYDYMLGKLLSIVLLVFGIGFVPILLMYLTKLLVSQDITVIFHHFFLFIKLLLFFILYSLFLASLVILVSSAMKSSRMVLVIVLVIYFVSGIISGIISTILSATGFIGAGYGSLLSFDGIIKVLLAFLIKGDHGTTGIISILLMLGFSFIALIISRTIIKRTI